MILDGFGHSESHEGNAIYAAKKPVLDRLWATAPNGLISGSGMDVGLPDGQMGNSEVGHMNLGAGRVVYQDFTRVTKSIRDGEFFENPTICAAVDKAVAAGKAVHFMGLLSDGGVHSHQDHLVAMAELAAKRGAEKSTCTPSSTATHRKARNRRSNCSTPLSRRWARAASPASSAVTSPWTATTAGTA
jgi:2,3-bisphosphoglycerate-independent phosphoglycerate mutase